jgi:hypothetical protein
VLAHPTVAFFKSRMPPNLHLVLATRSDPMLPLARLRASGDIAGLGHLTTIRCSNRASRRPSAPTPQWPVAPTTPKAYGRRVAALFGMLTLPYDLGTVASFDYTGFNGRSLHDNVMDNMLSLLTNSALGTGIAPDLARFVPTFPYLQPVTAG